MALSSQNDNYWSRHGLRIIDGPFGDFSDPDGFIAHAKGYTLGCEGNGQYIWKSSRFSE